MKELRRTLTDQVEEEVWDGRREPYTSLLKGGGDTISEGVWGNLRSGPSKQNTSGRMTRIRSEKRQLQGRGDNCGCVKRGRGPKIGMKSGVAVRKIKFRRGEGGGQRERKGDSITRALKKRGGALQVI